MAKGRVNEKFDVSFVDNTVKVMFKQNTGEREFNLNNLPSKTREYLLRRGFRQMLGLNTLDDTTPAEAMHSFDQMIALFNDGVLPGEGGRGIATPLNIEAYRMYRRFVAINAGHPDPKLSQVDAIKALEELEDNEDELKKLRGNEIWKISYRKAKELREKAKPVDQKQKELEAKFNAMLAEQGA